MRHGQLHVLGKSNSTGPGRPWRVSSKARLTTAATSSTARTWVFHLVTEREMPMASHSWKASVPMAAVATWPLMHSTGIESHMASSRPEVVLAMPAGRHEDHAGAAGAAGIALGGMDGGLLVTHQHMAQARLGVERVVQRQHGAAG